MPERSQGVMPRKVVFKTRPSGHPGKKKSQNPVSMRSLGCTVDRKLHRLDSSRLKNQNQFPGRPAGALEIDNFRNPFRKLKDCVKLRQFHHLKDGMRACAPVSLRCSCACVSAYENAILRCKVQVIISSIISFMMARRA